MASTVWGSPRYGAGPELGQVRRSHQEIGDRSPLLPPAPGERGGRLSFRSRLGAHDTLRLTLGGSGAGPPHHGGRHPTPPPPRGGGGGPAPPAPRGPPGWL